MKKNSLIWLIAIFYIFSSCKGRPEFETYLIPYGFKGKVNVIFNQSHGAPVKYEGNRRIYEIPVNGILLTQFKDEEGLVNHEYFYVDSSGNRIPLKIFLDKDSTKEVGVFRDGTVGVYGNSDDPKSLSYQEFYISNRGELDNYFTLQFQKQFEDNVKQVTGYEF